MKYFIILVVLFLPMSSAIAQNASPDKVVDALLIAYNNRDIDAFVATYAEDVACYEYGQDYPFVEGKQSLRGSYDAMFRASPDLHAKSTNRIVQGNKVIDNEVVEGINGQPAIQVVVIYEVHGGLIRKVTFIY